MYSFNLLNFILYYFVNMGYRCNSIWVYKFCLLFYIVNIVKLMNKLYEILIYFFQFVYLSFMVLFCLEIMNGIVCIVWCYCKIRVIVKYSRIIIVFGGLVFMVFVGYQI